MASRKTHRTVIDRSDGWIALGLGVLSLALYVRTLVPGLLPSDGGEFQTLAYVLGHAHTTGYEVYTLLAKLFTLLVPLGDIAYRVNLLSAVYAGLTIAFVYLASRVLSRNRVAGLLAALALAISATFWSQSIIAEVYTAGTAFTSAILLLVLLWYETGKVGFLFVAGALGGLGIGVHGSNSLFAPAILVLLLTRFHDLRRTWKPALGGVLLGVALMVAAFALVDAQPTQASVIHSVYQPSISRWDLQPADLDSFGGRFRFLVFAQQWRSTMFVDPATVMPENFHTLRTFLEQDFALPILALIPLGLLSLFLRDWRLGLFFVVALAVHSLYTLNYRIGDIYVFFLSLYVYLIPLVAGGAALLLRALARLPGSWAKIAPAGLALLLLVFSTAPFVPQRIEALKAGELRFQFMGLPTNQELADWHKMISFNVEGLDQNAIVLMDWPDLYGYYYVAQVEQGRDDLLFLETYPYAMKQGMADTLISFLKEAIQKGRPVLAVRRYDELQRGGLRLLPRPVGITDMYSVKVR